MTIAEVDGGGDLGVGLVNYPSAEVRYIMGKASQEIQDILGFCHSEEVIHRDNLVVFENDVES